MKRLSRWMKWSAFVGALGIVCSLALDRYWNYVMRGRKGDPEVLRAHTAEYWERSAQTGKWIREIQPPIALVALVLMGIALAYAIGRGIWDVVHTLRRNHAESKD